MKSRLVAIDREEKKYDRRLLKIMKERWVAKYLEQKQPTSKKRGSGTDFNNYDKHVGIRTFLEI